MSLLQEFSLTLPRSEVLSSNGGRGDRYGHGKKVKNIVERARWAVRGLSAMDSVFLIVRVYRAANYRYDASNLHETVKPCVDAVVRCGLLEDDSNEFLVGPLIVPGGVDSSLRARNGFQGERVRFRFMFFDDADIRRKLAVF